MKQMPLLHLMISFTSFNKNGFYYFPVYDIMGCNIVESEV